MKYAAAVLPLLLLATGCARAPAGARGRRVIVLGVDAMDPNFVERHWNELPNLRRLRDLGGFSRLRTTTPPQSPVAWATFITGLDPAGHGIFDFVARDPATMEPLSSMAQTMEPAHQLCIGSYLFPLSKARVRSLRAGRAFWELLAGDGIPVTIIKMPTNYPPVAHGVALAGMGTPDLEGTFGTFTYYTDDPLVNPGPVSGGRIITVAPDANGRVVLPIEGPPNSLRRDHRSTQLDMVADIDPDNAVMRCRIGSQQFILKQGEWSPWIRVHFKLIDGLAQTSGMFRLYARELHPAIRIYRSPLNIDALDPALPISSPASYSRGLAQRVGEFYTQGIPEDTSALRQGVLSLDEYLEQSRLVSREERAMLRDSLDHFNSGFLFFYFSEVDQNSHMLWGRHKDELLRTYQTVDQAIGDVLTRAGDAEVTVMSDHGFAAFNRAVNLNTWLEREGFLTTRGSNIDWSHTKAYAMGLNSLYINLAGREKNGVVHSGAERDSLARELVRRLESFRDPDTGAKVMENVSAVPQDAGRFAPDFIVGYAPGYRASWETALGAAPPDLIHANTDAWIADHCIAADEVPGVLLANRPLRIADASLKDLTTTILEQFNVKPDVRMTGRRVY